MPQKNWFTAQNIIRRLNCKAQGTPLLWVMLLTLDYAAISHLCFNVIYCAREVVT